LLEIAIKRTSKYFFVVVFFLFKQNPLCWHVKKKYLIDLITFVLLFLGGHGQLHWLNVHYFFQFILQQNFQHSHKITMLIETIEKWEDTEYKITSRYKIKDKTRNILILYFSSSFRQKFLAKTDTAIKPFRMQSHFVINFALNFENILI
jgi:hypothetical protein